MSIGKRVIDIVSKNIEKGHEVTLSANLVEDLGVDSFGVLMIITALEDEFGITVDEEDFKDIITVRNIVEQVKTKYLPKKG